MNRNDFINGGLITPVTFFLLAGLRVRAVQDNRGGFWYVAADICAALGFKRHTLSVAYYCKEAPHYAKVYSSGGAQKTRVLHEADVQRLIDASQRPTAKLKQIEVKHD